MKYTKHYIVIFLVLIALFFKLGIVKNALENTNLGHKVLAEIILNYLDISKGLEHTTHGGLDFYTDTYDSEMNESYVKITKVINGYFDEKSRIFDSPEDMGLKILVFKTHGEYMEIYGLGKGEKAGSFANAMMDKLISLSCDYLDKSVIEHEYTHCIQTAFMNENGIGFENIPRWFKEGIAEYESDSKHEDFDMSVKFDLDKLEQTEFYTVGYNAINKIVETKGKGAIIDILLLSKEMPFNNALEQVTGMTIDSFENSLVKEYKYELYNIAKEQYKSREYDKAKDNLIKFLEKYPKESYAKALLMDSYMNQQKYKEAVAVFRSMDKSEVMKLSAWELESYTFLSLQDGENEFERSYKDIRDEIDVPRVVDDMDAALHTMDEADRTSDKEEKLKLYLDMARRYENIPSVGIIIVDYAIENYSVDGSKYTKIAENMKNRYVYKLEEENR